MSQKKGQLKIGIILNYVNMIIGNLIPIFYTPIMLQLLGQNEYGLYKLSSSVTSYLSLISMGLGAALTRYLIKAKTENGQDAEEKMLGFFVIIFNVIGVITFLVGLVLTNNLYRWYGNSLSPSELARMQILVFLLVCNMSLGFSLSPYISVVTSHEKFVFYQSMNILITCIAPILNLVVLFLGAASVGMAIVTLAITILNRILYQCYITRSMRIKPQFHNLPFGQLREVLMFSFWIFLANVVGQLYNTTDTVMIGMIPTLATAGVAVYNIGSMFNNIVFSLTTGVSSMLLPKTNQMVFAKTDSTELTNFAIRIGRLQGYVICLLVGGFIAFGKPFITLYAGPEYEEAYWVAVFMMVPNIIPLVQSVCLSIIVAQNKHQFRSMVYLFIAIINVIGTWFLMQRMGIVGAALVTGAALVIGQGFLMNWYYHKKTGLNMVKFWKEIGKLYIIPMILTSLTVILSKYVDFSNIPLMIAGILLYMVIYCVANWVLIMNNYEKNLILEPLNFLRSKIKR